MSFEARPSGLDYVFFSDSGSTSVEVALKMALGYWHNIGEPRSEFWSCSIPIMATRSERCRARGVFNAAYTPLLFEVTSVPFPDTAREQATLDALEAACRSEKPAAFIVEPWCSGPVGCGCIHAGFLR